jgi:hypothetical protein
MWPCKELQKWHWMMIALYAQIVRCPNFKFQGTNVKVEARWFNPCRTCNNFQMSYYVHFPLIAWVYYDTIIAIRTTYKLGLWTSSLHIKQLTCCVFMWVFEWCHTVVTLDPFDIGHEPLVWKWIQLKHCLPIWSLVKYTLQC